MIEDTLNELFSAAVAEVRVPADLPQSAIAGAHRRQRRRNRRTALAALVAVGVAGGVLAAALSAADSNADGRSTLVPAGPSAKTQVVAHSHLPSSPVLRPGTGLPNEGVWKTVVTSKGYPAVQLTYVRPDAVHTSQYATLMWLDPQLLSVRLHEGIPSGDPGGTWTTPPEITPELAKTVAAAIPGGFRTTPGSPVGSKGGYYDDGRTAVPLRNGAASLVIYKSGAATIGEWGRELTMNSSIESVRQNLGMLVDHGAIAQSCSSDSSPVWGYTVGNDAFVPRTALGVRTDGTLIFVNSPAVSVCGLGQLLQSAGVQWGMELDINNDWSIGSYFTHEGGQLQSHASRPGQSQPGDVYLSPQSRDFIAFYLRP